MRFSSASSVGQVSLTNLGVQHVFRNVSHGLGGLFAWLVVHIIGLCVVWLGLWVSVVGPWAGGVASAAGETNMTDALRPLAKPSPQTQVRSPPQKPRVLDPPSLPKPGFGTRPKTKGFDTANPPPKPGFWNRQPSPKPGF